MCNLTTRCNIETPVTGRQRHTIAEWPNIPVKTGN